MFEFDEYEKRFHAGAADPAPAVYQPVTDIEEMSFLHWGEHCIECAAPDCYATCDLYQSRPDGNCRRFAYGIYKNKRFRSLRGYGAEISFKTWGRLKANGNTRMEPIRRLLWKEQLIGFGVPILNALGSALYASTGNRRWKNLAPDLDRIARRSHRRAESGRRPDLFLIEVFNPQPHPVTIQLTMRIGEGFYDEHPNPASLPPPFTASVTLEPGYSSHRFDRRKFEARMFMDQPRGERARIAGCAGDQDPGPLARVGELFDSLSHAERPPSPPPRRRSPPSEDRPRHRTGSCPEP